MGTQKNGVDSFLAIHAPTSLSYQFSSMVATREDASQNV